MPSRLPIFKASGRRAIRPEERQGSTSSAGPDAPIPVQRSRMSGRRPPPSGRPVGPGSHAGHASRIVASRRAKWALLETAEPDSGITLEPLDRACRGGCTENSAVVHRNVCSRAGPIGVAYRIHSETQRRARWHSRCTLSARRRRNERPVRRRRSTGTGRPTASGSESPMGQRGSRTARLGSARKLDTGSSA